MKKVSKIFAFLFENYFREKNNLSPLFSIWVKKVHIVYVMLPKHFQKKTGKCLSQNLEKQIQKNIEELKKIVKIKNNYSFRLKKLKTQLILLIVPYKKIWLVANFQKTCKIKYILF